MHLPSICVLAAPSGFGKITLVRDWPDSRTDENAASIVWVPFVAPVPSRLAFWEALAWAAERAGVSVGLSAGVRGSPGESDEMVRVVAMVLPDRAIVVLDTYENLSDLKNQISDLAFTHDEVGVLLECLGTAESAEYVWGTTSGYPLAVRTVMLSLRDTARHRALILRQTPVPGRGWRPRTSGSSLRIQVFSTSCG